jgi:hypothetical protein
MGDWKRFTEESPLAGKIKVPTRIVVHRFDASSVALSGILASRTFDPEGGEICELEAGGRIVGRGKIVKRRGVHCMKIAEIAEEGV